MTAKSRYSQRLKYPYSRSSLTIRTLNPTKFLRTCVVLWTTLGSRATSLVQVRCSVVRRSCSRLHDAVRDWYKWGARSGRRRRVCDDLLWDETQAVWHLYLEVTRFLQDYHLAEAILRRQFGSRSFIYVIDTLRWSTSPITVILLRREILFVLRYLYLKESEPKHSNCK